MSVHNGTDYDYKVGEIIQRMVDEGYAEEMLVAKSESGGWDVWGDKRAFWTALLTPSEIEVLRKENDYAKSVILDRVRLRELIHDILDDHDCSLSTRELIEAYYGETEVSE